MYSQFNSFMASLNRFTDRLFQIVFSPRATITYWLAIFNAEKRFIQTGVRHYVIPSTRHRVLRVTDFHAEMHSQGLDMTKKRGFHNRDLSRPTTLMDQAFYWTRSHKCRYRFRRSMSPQTKRLRRQLFYNWWNTPHAHAKDVPNPPAC